MEGCRLPPKAPWAVGEGCGRNQAALAIEEPEIAPAIGLRENNCGPETETWAGGESLDQISSHRAENIFMYFAIG